MVYAVLYKERENNNGICHTDTLTIVFFTSPRLLLTENVPSERVTSAGDANKRQINDKHTFLYVIEK